MLVYPRGAVCVRVVRFTLHHDGRLVPAPAGHIAGLASADDLGEVFLSAEQYFDVLVQASASIEAGVYHDAFALVVLAQDVRVNRTETGIIHRFDVHIAQTSVRPAFYVFRPLLYPARIEQAIHCSVAYGFHHFFPALVCFRVVKRYQGFLACLSI